MANEPVTPSSLRALYDRLRTEAPEAAIGVAAITVMITLITAAAVSRYSSAESQYVLLGVAALFGLVGVGGFALAMYRARS